ncbi:MAG TPA: family 10 glycosylhydrolase [Verrucomicrobiae bacterium]|nr:family 10 glycosylhydrolase [Verrucomicrobiae bacterium]
MAALTAISSVAATSYVPSNVTPPPPRREFRAAWIATVGNSVWPSQPDLPVSEQKAELVAIVDRAAQLKLNALIFQVRPSCDALYASKLEPWSEYLTGTMGKAPSPFYDPLEFAIAEAHKRGIELHAWFNPYRAHHFNARSPIASSHISKTRPQLVRRYGRYLWLDPGEREVQEYSLSVVMDVLKRYDVDGIHFDDYFYPYPEEDGRGQELNFPDNASWQKFGAKSGLSRSDWRRDNVNDFVERTYKSIKATKPWVKFGISPFGIWRPGNPAPIRGFDAYDRLYADARKWMINGWADYFAPQLYWGIDQREQSFPVLLNWWVKQNPKQRHIWPGINTTKVQSNRSFDGETSPPWTPDEIVNQIRLAARQPVSAGHIHWNMKAVWRSPELTTALQRGAYAEPALVPACPWLSTNPLAKPTYFISDLKTGGVRLICNAAAGQRPNLWLLQARVGGLWQTEVIPSEQLAFSFKKVPDVIAVTPIDRASVAGKPLVLAKRP